MRRQSSLLAFVAGAMLALAGTNYAQTPAAPATTPPQAPASNKKAANALTSVARGTVQSISGSQLVVGRKVKGKETDLTFQLNAETLKKGDIKAGSKVTVHYRNDNNQDIATMVRVNPRVRGLN